VVICSLAPGDFTTEGHFIVIASQTEDGLLDIRDPNSEERSKRQWEAEYIASQSACAWAFYR
jgi:hypothetical protein